MWWWASLTTKKSTGFLCIFCKWINIECGWCLGKIDGFHVCKSICTMCLMYVDAWIIQKNSIIFSVDSALPRNFSATSPVSRLAVMKSYQPRLKVEVVSMFIWKTNPNNEILRGFFPTNFKFALFVHCLMVKTCLFALIVSAVSRMWQLLVFTCRKCMVKGLLPDGWLRVLYVPVVVVTTTPDPDSSFTFNMVRWVVWSVRWGGRPCFRRKGPWNWTGSTLLRVLHIINVVFAHRRLLEYTLLLM